MKLKILRTVFSLPCMAHFVSGQEQDELSSPITVNGRRVVLHFIEKLAWESSFGWKQCFLIY